MKDYFYLFYSTDKFDFTLDVLSSVCTVNALERNVHFHFNHLCRWKDKTIRRHTK